MIPQKVSIFVGIKFDDQRFLFQGSSHTWSGLYLYSADGGGLEKFIDYPKKAKGGAQLLEMNFTKTKLLGLTIGGDPIFDVDLNTNELKWKALRSESEGRGVSKCVVRGSSALAVMKDWNATEKAKFDDISKSASSLSYFYVASKDLIVMIASGWNNNMVFVFDVNTKEWKKKMQLPILPDANLKCALTGDERYIIMSYWREGYIFVLNLCEFEIYKYSLPPPLDNDDHWIALTRDILKDEKVVFGWIGSRHEVSTDVMRFIAKWYYREEIHMIGMFSRKHFITDVDMPLSSLEKVKTINH